METYQIIVLALFFSLVVLEISFANFFKKNNQKPKEIGVENLTEVSALTQLFWPIFRSPQETNTEEA